MTLPTWTRDNRGSRGDGMYQHPDARTIVRVEQHQAARGWVQLGLVLDGDASTYWMTREGSQLARQLELAAGMVLPADFRWSILGPCGRAQ